MKNIKTNYNEYEITTFCGDCLECETGCETGANIIAKNDWTPEDVEKACKLLLEGLNTEVLQAMKIKK